MNSRPWADSPPADAFRLATAEEKYEKEPEILQKDFQGLF
jgi:hypothetical protein